MSITTKIISEQLMISKATILIELLGVHESCDWDVGILSLERDNREYALDSFTTTYWHSNDRTKIRIELEEDRDTVTDCKYDLTKEDLRDCEASYFFPTEATIKRIILVIQCEEGSRLIKKLNF